MNNVTGLEMHQTANSQNVQFDTNYKHNMQRVLELLKNFPARGPTQPTKNPLKISTQPDPTQPSQWDDQTHGQLWCG